MAADEDAGSSDDFVYDVYIPVEDDWSVWDPSTGEGAGRWSHGRWFCFLKPSSDYRARLANLHAELSQPRCRLTSAYARALFASCILSQQLLLRCRRRSAVPPVGGQRAGDSSR